MKMRIILKYIYDWEKINKRKHRGKKKLKFIKTYLEFVFLEVFIKKGGENQ